MTLYIYICIPQLQQFSGLGGASFGAATRRMLEMLLSHQVAIQYSWAGQKGKKKFMDLTVTAVICKAVRSIFPDIKISDVEGVIKVWLRHAGEKLKKLRARASLADQGEDTQGSPTWSGYSDEGT